MMSLGFKGYDEDLSIYNRDTALHIAAKRGHEDVVEVLLEDERVNANAQNGGTVVRKNESSGIHVTA